MLFRDTSFDTNLFWQIYYRHILTDQNFAVVFFFVLPVFSICHNCESLSQNMELAIINHTEYLSNHSVY